MRLRWCWFALVTGCSVPNGESWQQAIPDGTYDTTPVICTSTQTEPLYQKPVHPLVLYNFHQLAVSKLVVQNPKAWRVLEDKDCKAAVELEVSLNADDELAFRNGRKTTFIPMECALGIKFGDDVLSVRQADSAFLSDDSRSDRSTDFSFRVSSTDNGYLLRAQQTPELDKVWETFGCSAADTVEFQLRSVKIMK